MSDLTLEQTRFNVKKLKTFALKAAVARLQEWERLPVQYVGDEWFQIITDFRAFAGPIIPFLVEYGSFQESEKITILLTALIKKKTFKLNICYKQQICMLVWYDLFDSEALQRVTEVTGTNFFVNSEGLWSKVPNLRKVRILLSDYVLEVLARSFPELSVLDSSSKCWSQITDRGLQLLAQLKKLRYVLFSKDDDYECTNVTGKAMATLLTQLPELVKFTCPVDIMSDALDFLLLSKSLLPTVKSLYFGNFEVFPDVYIDLGKVFPNLERLEIRVAGSVTVSKELIRNFPPIKEMRVTFEWIYGNVFECVGKQLLVLHLKSISFKPGDLLTISDECPNVKFLHYEDCGGEPEDRPTPQDCLRTTWPLLFPRMETLEFIGEDLNPLYFFFHNNSNLIDVAITGYAGCSKVLECLRPDYGFCKKVECMSVTLKGFRDEVVYNESVGKHLVEVFPSLRRLLVSIAKEEEGIILTSSRGNDVLLCSNSSYDLLLVDPELDYLDGLKFEKIN